MPVTSATWCTRVSKKVLYETPYAVTGGIVYTGLEMTPKLEIEWITSVERGKPETLSLLQAKKR